MALVTFADNLETGNYHGVSVRGSSALTSSLVYTDWIDVRLFEAVDWTIYLTAQGSITRLDLVIQWSVEATPNDTTDWSDIQVESIDSAGVATLNTYDLRKTIS